MKEIIEGWSKQIADELGLLDEETKELSRKRLEVCGKCPLKTELGFCNLNKKITVEGKEYTGCGCFLPAKTKVKNATCPANKW